MPRWTSKSDGTTLAGLFLIGLLLRLWLIHHYPIVFGGDTILHLANRDRLLMGHQLPLLQIVLYAVGRVTWNLVITRCVLGVVGAASGVGFYLLVRVFVSPTAALMGSLLFTANPFLVELSIVPFQETLMMTLLLFAFACYFRDCEWAAAVFLALACMTRYEAWIACPLMVLWNRRSLRTLLLFGIAPAAWIAAHLGISSPGTYVIEWPHSAARLMRWAYLAWITVKNTPILVLALAAIGLWRIRQADRRMWLLGAFLTMLLLATLFSAHGVSPDPERYVASREAAMLIAGTLVIAAWGLQQLDRRAAVVLAAAAFVWCIVDAHRVLRRDTAEAHLQLSYRLAQYLDGNMRPNETALIVAKPFGPQDYAQYLGKVREREGQTGVERAIKMAAEVNASPIDCWRTIVHSRLGPRRLSCDATTASWIAVWSDSGSPQPACSTTLRAGNLAVCLYHP